MPCGRVTTCGMPSSNIPLAQRGCASHSSLNCHGAALHCAGCSGLGLQGPGVWRRRAPELHVHLGTEGSMDHPLLWPNLQCMSSCHVQGSADSRRSRSCRSCSCHCCAVQLTSPGGRHPSLLSHLTHKGHWRLVRRGTAPAFSPKNIRRAGLVFWGGCFTSHS